MKKRSQKMAKKRKEIVVLDPEVGDDVEEVMDVNAEQQEEAGGTSGSEVEDEESDSVKELQIALRDGLLKTDSLNYVVEKKRPLINKTEDLKNKLEKFVNKLPWLEFLDVTVQNEVPGKVKIDDDFQRELIFYKQAEKAAQSAVPRLLKMGITVFRPTDYYAEMAKTDDHMQKVRRRLLDIQEGKERQEAFKRLREEKKFAAKVQKEVLEGRQSEKKKLMEAVKKHRKGMKAELERMLDNAKRIQADEDEEDESTVRTFPAKGKGKNVSLSSRVSRVARNKKFGFGGQKKRSKQNTKESFSDVSGAFQSKRKMKVTGRGSKGRSGRR